ncbi:lipase 3-like [Thrips palmi]|uniref:Lipase n=1 Tax=Thrips palmi TaxID=161013 RepID=A0A6P8ZXG7_THRPL|nr:lipase 3-like [Thrips palmi]
MSTSLRIAVLALAALLAGVAASPTSPRDQPWWHHLAAPKSIGVSTLRDVPIDSSTPMLIAKYGYQSETHTITTADGYLLTMHRIPNPGKPVIYLQHGILSSSADWVVLGPEKSLAFILYNAGYDVWMGNFRGNTYSRAHSTLSTKDKAFWDFSWHEIGMNDIPAMIDFILDSTQHDSLVYVGHSQGTTAFLVMASMRPEYNAKVKAFIAMAPIAFLGKVGSLPLKLLAKGVDEVEFIANVVGMYEFMPSSAFMSAITSRACADGSMLQAICTNALFVITGYDSEELDTEMLPEIMKNVPAGASTKQLLHYAQLINSDKFRQYDHGTFNNLITYKSFSPPNYPLDKITTKVFLHFADNDLLGTPTGVDKLRKGLTNVKMIRRVPHPTYNHMDFLYARDSRPLLYDQVMQSIAEVFQEQ